MLCDVSSQEVLARGVLLPLINQLSDPDYINQFVIWMVRHVYIPLTYQVSMLLFFIIKIVSVLLLHSFNYSIDYS